MTEVAILLRSHQEADPVLGPLFKALHTFADRTIEEFFGDVPDMPHPVVAMEKDRQDRRGYYTRRDGYALEHRINLNPYLLPHGDAAAETLAHELVHMWQELVGRPIQRNYHSAEFHARMALYGIKTEGKRGNHVGYIGTTWGLWMDINQDLELHRFILPGADHEPGRQLVKHECPKCGANFRNRNILRVQCLECNLPYEVVEPRR